MAFDNKNYGNMASDSPDGATELQVLSVDLIPTDEELEMDADTCSLEALESTSDDQRSVAILRSDLRSRDERISSLQYDIEQLRSRWAGLEREIEAREELTTRLQSDLKVAYKRLSEKDQTISRLKRSLEKLAPEPDASVDGDDALAKDLDAVSRKLEEMTRRSESDAARIRRLESELEAAGNDLARPFAGTRDATNTIEAAVPRGIPGNAPAEQSAGTLDDLRSRYAARGDELARLRRIRGRIESDLQDSNAERGRITAMLKVARSENADLRARLKKARETIVDYTQNEQPITRQRLAEQEGRIAELGDYSRTLESRLAKSEEYADQLRRKIEALRDGGEDFEKRATELAASLDRATRRVVELDGQVRTLQEQVAALELQLGSERDAHAEQLDALRGEVEKARITVAGRDSRIDELARELSEAIRIRDELTQELGHSTRESAERIESLVGKIRGLEVSLAEAEEKIANKDNAISALLNELANKSQSIESIDEIEHVIQEIDGRMSERIDDPQATDRDRPTRVLTGTIDGQELRFPLFKNRLTIGRTATNDIQLRAQYVSRRHAFLLIEGDSTRIVDWGSKNGVYVNDARIAEKALDNGDRITIGNAEFVFEERARREHNRGGH